MLPEKLQETLAATLRNQAAGLGDTNGVLVVNVQEGPARSTGIQAGDVIVRLDMQVIVKPADIVRTLADLPVDYLLEIIVKRAGQPLLLLATLGPGHDDPAKANPEAARQTALENGSAGPPVLELTLQQFTPALIERSCDLQFPAVGI